jgi:hypothetical protein
VLPKLYAMSALWTLNSRAEISRGARTRKTPRLNTSEGVVGILTSGGGSVFQPVEFRVYEGDRAEAHDDVLEKSNCIGDEFPGNESEKRQSFDPER